MNSIFVNVLNMSITASYVIAVILLLRLAIKKAPKFISYSVWIVVAVRLLVPFSIESMFCLIPKNAGTITLPTEVVYQQSKQVVTQIVIVEPYINNTPAPNYNIDVIKNISHAPSLIDIVSLIWVVGVVAMITYSIVSTIILIRRLKDAQPLERNIYQSKHLKTPFVFGVIRPKIYLPTGLSADERTYVIMHEMTHVRRGDHIIKLFAFFVLSIHWFNPLVWVAFIKMSTDMELSCDERVLKTIKLDKKRLYANLLLSLATGEHYVNGSSLAFGEGNVKVRVNNVLNYKKSSFWVVSASLIVVASIGIALLLNPVSNALGIDKISEVTDESNAVGVFANETSNPGETNVKSSVLDILYGQYRTGSKDRTKFYKAILINNQDEYNAFIQDFNIGILMEGSLEQNLNSNFFDEYVIYAYVTSESSGSIKVTVNGVEIDGNILKLKIDRTIPEVGTCDMAYRACLFGIKRDDIKEVKSVEVLIYNHRLNIETSQYEELDIHKAEYSTGWRKEADFYTPTVITSLDEYNAYLESHLLILQDEDALKYKYDSKFFEEYVLYTYAESHNSGSIKLSVKNAYLEGNTLHLRMERYTPKMVDHDMAARICFFGIKKEDFKRAENIKIQIINILQS